ncbi:MAG: chromosome segregation protein SMC, partial [Balneolaceae bacterium]|nr:chromosome segregation protein SMC [Balneolaceae bacterium]
MYISELELQGFKSFAYKTKVTFDSGITAIVGPNGCGKSNIVDSMRWVLGEQRPTLLRSSTMANVIFNGTAQKNALGMAEVSLTFVNNKGLLPTEYSEVTITRRLYRSGESEYLINGTTCRLKDINELFMDTGMGSDAYSVIELKMVEEILNDKNDRRHLFEEAAGVTSYKEKRKKTFRKLESTQQDLQRVEDILVEVRKNTKSLEKQAEKATQAKKYRQELERLDKALSKHQYENIQEELDPLQERINNAEKEKKEIHNKLEELEEAEETARANLSEKERNQAEAQRRVTQLQSNIRDAETELQITREKISNEKGGIEQYTKDIEQAEKDLEELKEIYEQTEQKLDSFHNELKRAERNLSDSRERYSEIQQEYSSERKALNELEQQQSSTNRELNELQNKRIRIESRLENTEDDLQRIAGEIRELEQQIEELEEERTTLREQIAEAREQRDKNEEAIARARAERLQLSERRDELKDEIRGHKSTLDSVRSEIDLLREIADSNEAFPSSVQYLLEHHQNRFPLLDVVSNIFSTDQEHSVALESVLGEALNFVVVATLDDAKRAASILKEEGKGRATFIPMDQLTGTHDVNDDALYHKVESEERFDPLKRLLLGDVLLFSSADEAYTQLTGTRSVGVTPEGEVVTAYQFFQSGSKSKNAGMRVGLKDKIEKLEQRASAAREKITDAEQQLEAVNHDYDSIDIGDLEQKLKASEKEVRRLENQINSATSKIQIYQKNIGELKNRRQQKYLNEDQAREELEGIEPRQQELRENLEDIREQQEQKRAALEELE